jgi:biopolymer transport protein TolQ
MGGTFSTSSDDSRNSLNLLAFLLPAGWQGSLGPLIAQTGIVAKVVLLLLLFFSIFSWAIIYAKWRRFKALRADGERFMRAFHKARRLAEMNVVAENFPSHPLKAIFDAGYREASDQAGISGGGIRNSNALARSLQIASSQQLTRLEKNLSWLATAGAVSPFIGLFGTVWGIMDAFVGLGSAGAASLRAVGPGIAEALVTTAAGLFVAIPAVIAYNQFLGRIKELGNLMDNFSLEFLNAAERSSLEEIRR